MSSIFFFWPFLLCLLNLNKERGKNSSLSPACPFQFYCEVSSEGVQKRPTMEALLSLWLWPPGRTAEQRNQIQSAHGEFVCLVPVLIQ